ncbi:MAG TPA: CDP-alcohol phosphatidyltransferase family protein [Alphaproteobacteria bacterium]|nr:CDP-alcohol phosphatidyltransferase family protein [Alphaproteobacteria bacterium]
MSDKIDRRPIAAREWRVSRRLANWLGCRGINADAISLFGMAFGIGAGVFLAVTGKWPSAAWAIWLAAALLVQLRLAANMLDGMVALSTGTESKRGELFNEIPDRVSDSAVLIGLGYASGGDAVLGYAAALVAVGTAYVRAVGKVTAGVQEFCGPMAKQQRMFVVTLVALYGAVFDPRQGSVNDTTGLTPVTFAFYLIIIGGIVTFLRRLRRIDAALRGAS